MKKLFVITLAAMMIFSVSNAFAGGCGDYDCPGDRQANYNAAFNAFEDDYDYSSTGWRGNYNDKAWAEASGQAGGNLDVNADASGYTRIWFFKIDNPAIALGGYEADNKDKAWSWAKDYGQTSKAGAGAVSEGEASTWGLATGLNGCRETVESTVYVSGGVNQYNTAGEEGYSGGFVWGENSSGGYYAASDHDYESGNGLAFDTNDIEGKIITKGMTEVNIDPTGDHRSFTAMTENMVNVEHTGHLDFGNVGGGGFIQGYVQKSGSYAAGNASFNYAGQTSGSGNAQIQGQVNNGSTYSSVSGSGSAFAISHGTPDQK
jgi:hypothetical protein